MYNSFGCVSIMASSISGGIIICFSLMFIVDENQLLNAWGITMISALVIGNIVVFILRKKNLDEKGDIGHLHRTEGDIIELIEKGWAEDAKNQKPPTFRLAREKDSENSFLSKSRNESSDHQDS